MPIYVRQLVFVIFFILLVTSLAGIGIHWTLSITFVIVPLFFMVFYLEPYLNFNYIEEYPNITEIDGIKLVNWKGNKKNKKAVAFYHKIDGLNDKKLKQYFALLTKSQSTLCSITDDKFNHKDDFHKEFRLKIDSIYTESLSYLSDNFDMLLEMKHYNSKYKNQKRSLHKSAGDDEKINRIISEFNIEKANKSINENYRSVWAALVIFNELIVDIYNKPSCYERYCSEDIEYVMLQIDNLQKSF